MDEIDEEIIRLLSKDSNQSNRLIGEKCFISGQAVSQRRLKMEQDGMIIGSCIKTSFPTVHIEIYLNKNNFTEFEMEILNFQDIISLEKITGGYCYHLKYLNLNDQDYRMLLETIERFARYKVHAVSQVII